MGQFVLPINVYHDAGMFLFSSRELRSLGSALHTTYASITQRYVVLVHIEV